MEEMAELRIKAWGNRVEKCLSLPIKSLAPPWKSGPLELALSLSKGPRKPANKVGL
jgi:hypothetical protein